LKMLPLILLLSVLECPSGDPPKCDQWDRMTRIAVKETRRRHYRIGGHGEVSEFQLMPATIRNYNRAHKTDFQIDEVAQSRILSRMVADWAVQWHLWRYRDEVSALRIVLSVSAYNTGYKLTDRRVVRWVYVQDVEPFALSEVERIYHVKRGKEFMWIGGRK